MLKKKLLISLVIVQGLFIFIGIIAIIFGVFYKMNMINKSPNLMNENIDFSNIYLIDKNQYKSQCEEGTRTTEFVDFFEDMEIQGEKYSFCVQKGTNTLAIVGTMMYKDGFTYILMSSASPEDYQRCFYIMGYIITRISLQ